MIPPRRSETLSAPSRCKPGTRPCPPRFASIAAVGEASGRRSRVTRHRLLPYWILFAFSPPGPRSIQRAGRRERSRHASIC